MVPFANWCVRYQWQGFEINMTQSTSVSQFRSEFDDFLYAPIEERGDGTRLSVLSALARLDVDPWKEAANLAQMSRVSATLRLSSLFAALPDAALAHLDSSKIAGRLIALLPHRNHINIGSHQVLPVAGAPSLARAFLYTILINMIFMALAFGEQYLTADHQPPPRAGFTHALAVKTSVPKVSPPTFD